MRYSEFQENRISGVPTLAGGATDKFKKAKAEVEALDEDDEQLRLETAKKGSSKWIIILKNGKKKTVDAVSREDAKGKLSSEQLIIGAKSIKKVTESENKTLNPPSITVGDEVKTGKFRNSKATVKGFKKDDHNQPVLKTNKGDKKLFRLRLSKLQEDELAQAEKDVDDEMKMKKANLKVNAAKRRYQEKIAAAMKKAGYVEEEASPGSRNKYLQDIAYEVSKYEGKSTNPIERVSKTFNWPIDDVWDAAIKYGGYDKIKEKAPPGREKQVKALKGKVDNPYAVSWASYNKSKNK